MKHFLPILFFALKTCSSIAQQYAAIDEYALNAPPSQSISVVQLARYLSKAAQNDTEKARVIYAWLALNIHYADSTAGASLWLTPQDIQRQKPAAVLRNRTAVCQGYANLFVALAHEMGLRSEVVTGICRQPDGEIPRIGHAWVVARLDGEWQLFDPTWGAPPAGEIRWKPQEQYFMASPKQFVLQHLPEDPMWQLLDYPVTEKDFRELSALQITEIIDAETGEPFMYRDTLTSWLSTDSTARFETTIHRLLRFHDGNERLLSEIGRYYYMRFYLNYITLDSLADEAIMNSVNPPDSVSFRAGIADAQRDFERAARYFAQVQSPERRENIQTFLVKSEVTAMLNLLNGDLYVATFECDTFQYNQETEFERLLRLQHLLVKAETCYEAAYPNLDCRKHLTHCQSLLHNRSLIRLKMGQRWVSWLTFDDQKSAYNINIVTSNARKNLENVLTDINDMTSLRPVFDYVERRRQGAIEQLTSLNLLKARQQRQLLMQDVEEFLQNKPLQTPKGNDLLKAMKKGLRHIESAVDSVENRQLNLSEEYRITALQNLYGERLVQFINTANLEYRLAVHLMKTAYETDYQTQKPQIQQYATQGLEHLRSATATLNQMMRSKMISQQEYRRREDTIQTLHKALVELSGI